MSGEKSYSTEEMDALMSEFIENTADELVTELQENWKKQKSEVYV